MREQFDAEHAGALLFPDHPAVPALRITVTGNRDPAWRSRSERLRTARPGLGEEHPRRRTVRLFVCEAHAAGSTDAPPLTDHDRAELRLQRA